MLTTPNPSPNRSTDDTLSPAPARTPKDYLGLVARGFAMGSADVVPGVSGGTMAFILGIYEELIFSIRAVGRKEFWQALLHFRIKDALLAINLPFLLAVFTGIFLAVLTLAQGLAWMLKNEPVLIWSFFFGLVLASVVTVAKRVKRWGVILVAALAVGAVGAFLLVGAVPAQTPNTWWFLFLSGALASVAMILPGISGAFILLILGKYAFVLDAVNHFDLVSLGILALGAAIGIVTFAQLLGYLFKRHHDLTVAILTGFMLGSLRKLWPWKETVETMLDSHGEPIPIRQINILPPAIDMKLFIAIGLMIIGIILVILIDRMDHGENSA
jgi:putative membrane protein